MVDCHFRPGMSLSVSSEVRDTCLFLYLCCRFEISLKLQRIASMWRTNSKNEAQVGNNCFRSYLRPILFIASSWPDLFLFTGDDNACSSAWVHYLKMSFRDHLLVSSWVPCFLLLLLEQWVGKDRGYPAVSLSATGVPCGDRRRGRSEEVWKDDRVQIENQIGVRVPIATSI